MRDYIITTENLQFIYKSGFEGDTGNMALSDISVRVSEGEFIAVLGRNGSGKSTFARLLNALLQPTKGVVLIKNLNTSDEKYIWEIRRSVGMVFQNPDNQIVATTVEEDVAFGPENLGVPPEEIKKRVDTAMETVGITKFRTHAPHLLSGGQKQKVAIAGILAMKPQCIVLDEATAMLDPVGRKDVMTVLKKLNREEGITIIHITHHMDEASMADRVIVMDKGAVVLDGKPSEVFSNVDRIKGLGLDVPQVTELFHKLTEEGFNLPSGILDIDEAVNKFKSIILRKDI
jgi:energy-coupling factor transport system ATP-binding protein